MVRISSKIHSLCIVFFTVLLLSGCGGGSGSDSDSTNISPPADPLGDITAPSGYMLSSVTNPIDSTNINEVGFSVTGAEIDARFFYDIFDSSSSTTARISANGLVVTSNFSVSDLDLSSLSDGAIRFEFYLQDESGNQGAVLSASSTKNTSIAAAPVEISGTISFDDISHNVATNGLDFSAITSRPSRGVKVSVLNSAGIELASTNTDEIGRYLFVVDANTDVQIQVQAKIEQLSPARWNVSVTDNTRGNALYALRGELSSSGQTNSIRNLHAPSGFGTPAYSSTRASAPFAIINDIYETVQKFAEIDSQIFFSDLEVRWSVNNSTASGALEDGDIRTSFYNGTAIYLLGRENQDTDEYDSHIIVHEWGHYFEDRLSRSDSIGGSHSSADRLDLRVAFGEGWGNALSGMILDDAFYRDSLGFNQASGFSINLERNRQFNEGWYNEGSVQSILYDLYDDNDDGVDSISLGLEPIYSALTSDAYIGNVYFTSIFAFLDELRTQQPSQVAAVNSLAIGQDINGTGEDGLGETNDGGLSQTLPVYKTVTIDGGSIEVCSTDINGLFNNLGVRDYVLLSISDPTRITINVNKIGVSAPSRPEIIVHRAGVRETSARNLLDDQVRLTTVLFPDDYIIEVYDSIIVNNNVVAPNQSACYDLSVTS